jgi:hypothetical protein
MSRCIFASQVEAPPPTCMHKRGPGLCGLPGPSGLPTGQANYVTGLDNSLLTAIAARRRPTPRQRGAESGAGRVHPW